MSETEVSSIEEKLRKRKEESNKYHREYQRKKAAAGVKRSTKDTWRWRVANGPIIKLSTGETWPNIRACKEEKGYSIEQILYCIKTGRSQYGSFWDIAEPEQLNE